MTRIPPSITKVFKRIAPSKRAADRSPTTLAPQPALKQKTVRFTQETQVFPSHHPLHHHENGRPQNASPAPEQKTPSNASHNSNKSEYLNNEEDKETTTNKDKTPHTESKISKVTQDKKAKIAKNALDPTIQGDLENLFSDLEKRQDDSSSQVERHETEFLRMSTSIDKKNRLETKKASPESALDEFLTLYEKEHAKSDTNTIDSSNKLSAEEKKDAILEINARQMTEKQV